MPKMNRYKEISWLKKGHLKQEQKCRELFLPNCGFSITFVPRNAQINDNF